MMPERAKRETEEQLRRRLVRARAELVQAQAESLWLREQYDSAETGKRVAVANINLGVSLALRGLDGASEKDGTFDIPRSSTINE